MKKNEKLYTWTKGENSAINEFFNTSEFSCQCDHNECIEQKISIELINNLTLVRKDIGPLKITSGFRCSAHQKELKESGVSTVVAKLSQHELGEAADIFPLKSTIEELSKIAPKYFKAIGTAKKFLHVDTRKDKTRRWVY